MSQAILTGGSPDYPVNHPPPVLHITPLKLKKLPWKPKAGISLGLKRQEPAFAQHRINAFLCQKLSYPSQLNLFNFLERKEVCTGTTAGSEVDSAQGTLSILPKTQRNKHLTPFLPQAMVGLRECLGCSD